MTPNQIRELIAANITTIIAVSDAHDPGVYNDGTHVCPCGLRGTQQQWETHLGEKIGERLAEIELQFPIGA